MENLALGKPATQSDVLWSYKPGLAVDGDPNTCSFTSREESPRWWQVGSFCLLDKDNDKDKGTDKDNFKMAASGYLFPLAFLKKTKIITTAQTTTASKEKSP